MDRFLKYTKGREPVLSINVVAAILLGAVVTLTTDRLGWAWDEYTLSLAGVGTLAIATWLARKGVWSPASHEQEVEAAYADGLGAQDRPGA
jgi:high-affinity Fe2+/Pb2+ permease